MHGPLSHAWERVGVRVSRQDTLLVLGERRVPPAAWEAREEQ